MRKQKPTAKLAENTMRYWPFACVLMLASCVPLRPVHLASEVSLLVCPKLSFGTQAVKANLTLNDIATIDIVPYFRSSTESYFPISSVTGNPTIEGDPNIIKLSLASSSLSPMKAFTLKRLKANSNYRIYARAYFSDNSQCSLDSLSFTDVALTSNDTPPMATLPLYVVSPTVFAATTSVTITTSGKSFDYLHAALVRERDNTLISEQDTVRWNPKFTFANLQGNTTYRLDVSAYRSGGVLMVTKSLRLAIANNDAPAGTAMALTVPAGVVTLAGSLGTGYVDGDGPSAKFNGPSSMALDTSGNLFIADSYNSVIRKITTDGVVSTFAGGQGSNYSGYQDGTGTMALFFCPSGLTIDTSNNLYVADSGNDIIRKITSTGVVTTLAGGQGYAMEGYANGAGTAALFSCPTGIALSGTYLYVADSGNNLIRRVTTSGAVTTLAGGAGNTDAGYANGQGTAALFNGPNGIAVSGSYVYIADTSNSLIRRMTTSGAVTTFAGGQGDTNSGYQNGAGTAALFSYPAGLAVDTAGNLYVADDWNDVIRKVTSSGVVSTYAGNWARSYLDGPNLSSSFNRPTAVVVDSAGNLYIADTGNNLIRKIE